MVSDVARTVARARRRNVEQSKRMAEDENRFEKENRAFYNRVLAAYMAIAQRAPQRVVQVDASIPSPRCKTKLSASWKSVCFQTDLPASGHTSVHQPQKKRPGRAGPQFRMNVVRMNPEKQRAIFLRQKDAHRSGSKSFPHRPWKREYRPRQWRVAGRCSESVHLPGQWHRDFHLRCWHRPRRWRPPPRRSRTIQNHWDGRNWQVTVPSGLRVQLWVLVFWKLHSMLRLGSN